MAHTICDRHKLPNRVRRIRDQVQAIERALEGEAGCEDVMYPISGCRGAINGLLAVGVDDHIHTHLIDRDAHPSALDTVAVEPLVQVVHSHFK